MKCMNGLKEQRPANSVYKVLKKSDDTRITVSGSHLIRPSPNITKLKLIKESPLKFIRIFIDTSPSAMFEFR